MLFLILICLLNEKSEGQYLYVNDIGTSSFHVTQKNELVLSSPVLNKSLNFINLGFSPVKHLGVFVGRYSHQRGITKGKGFNLALGTYFLIGPDENVFHRSKNKKRVGTLLYAKFGYGQSSIRNIKRISAVNFSESKFNYQKIYFDLGFQMITKIAKLDLNYKKSVINYLNGSFTGDYYNEYSYAVTVRENLKNNNLFTEHELNIQADIGAGYLNLFAGIPIVFPTKKGKPAIAFQRLRNIYFGMNLNLTELNDYVKTNRKFL